MLGSLITIARISCIQCGLILQLILGNISATLTCLFNAVCWCPAMAVFIKEMVHNAVISKQWQQWLGISTAQFQSLSVSTNVTCRGLRHGWISRHCHCSFLPNVSSSGVIFTFVELKKNFIRLSFDGTYYAKFLPVCLSSLLVPSVITEVWLHPSSDKCTIHSGSIMPILAACLLCFRWQKLAVN